MDEQGRGWERGTEQAGEPGNLAPTDSPSGAAHAGPTAEAYGNAGAYGAVGTADRLTGHPDRRAGSPDPTGGAASAATADMADRPADRSAHHSGPAHPTSSTGYGSADGAPAGAGYGSGERSGAYGPGGAAYAAAAQYPGGPVGPGGGIDPGGGTGGPRRKRPVRTAVVAAVAAAAVAVAGGVALAATRDGSGTSAQSGPGAGGGPGGTGGGPGGAGGVLAAVAHGEVVVADSSGSYVTRLVQTGTVSAVSATSITVKSADDYTVTYTVADGTSVDNGTDAIGDVATGHTVTVLASTDKAAVTVSDQNLASASGIPGGNGQNGGQAGTGGTN
ncbi:MAG TPA: hypothetical protein VMU51_15220 [Mycobacteriales bacterium]|nr:hypothetical protein [Mycobacteriales bacterium]